MALKATMDYYFLHNIAWYCDPDVILLRPSLPIEQARAWATLQGLTGQALLFSNRMLDLPESRVEILKKISPPVDIKPMDLFPSRRNKRIWDLKINHLERNYDVVGFFNFNEEDKEIIYLSWKGLGLPDLSIHVFDFWNSEYLGAWEKGISIEIPPASCKVLTFLPDNGNIQLISTSRHITQGWIDLISIKFDERELNLEGGNKVIGKDPYELVFVFPKGKNYRIKKVDTEKAPFEIFNHQGWAKVKIYPAFTGQIRRKVFSLHLTFTLTLFKNPQNHGLKKQK